MHCECCGKQGAALKSCIRCKSVFYCNRTCQKASWKKHKEVCRSSHQLKNTRESEITQNTTKNEGKKECSYCKKNDSDSLQLCSRCKFVFYCGKSCQKADWNCHKKSCSKFRNREQELHQMNQDSSVPSDQVAQMNKMFQILKVMRPEKAMKLKETFRMDIYESVPAVHEELIQLANEGQIMQQIDVKACYRLLKEAYDLTCGLCVHEIALVEPDTENPQVNAYNLAKRLVTIDPDTMEWFQNSKVGDVRANPGFSYDPGLWQSFSNARGRSEALTTGTTHIAVGFVDLTTLLWMHLKEQSQQQVDCPSQQRLHWVGYEASAYCGAKTLVISNMLLNRCDCDSIIEVWYSSAWSDSTSLAFFTSVRQLLEQQSHHQSAQELSFEVLSILTHWSTFEQKRVPLSKARRNWLKSIDSLIFDPLMDCLTLQDRNELSQYLLTGQVFPEATHGSVTMFGSPAYLGARARNESMFHSIGLRLLANTALTKGLTFLSAALHLLRQQVVSLQENIIHGKVVIEIHAPVVVSINNTSILDQIRGTVPYTISWSNILDYIPCEDFHSMASQCSAKENTVHYGYSMNWPVFVKGASCLDYSTGERMKTLLEAARNGINMEYELCNLLTILKSPPLTNPMNILDFILCRGRYQDWLNIFFKDVHNVADTEPSWYSPFARTNSTVYMTWSYDESINFCGVENNLN